MLIFGLLHHSSILVVGWNVEIVEVTKREPHTPEISHWNQAQCACVACPARVTEEEYMRHKTRGLCAVIVQEIVVFIVSLLLS